MIIVIEGIDGSGKSTIAKEISSLLNGIYLRYPTQKYRILREYLGGKVSLEPRALFHTFLADILDDQKSLTSNNPTNKPIIIDRYVFSTIAYEINGGYGYEDRKKIIELSKPMVPDKVIFLDVSPKICLERISHRILVKGGTFEKYEKLKYLNRIRDNFRMLYDERFLTPNWFRIESHDELSETVSAVYKKIRKE